MKNLRHTFAATVISLTLTLQTFAGDIGTGRSVAGDIGTGRAAAFGDIGTGFVEKTESSENQINTNDPILEALLNTLQNMFLLF